MDISVIIVNYNTEKEVVRCLESVLSQRHVHFDVWVVDNASQDNSVSVLEKYGDKINLVVNQENKGFPRANNDVVPQVRGKYLYMLNPDAWLEQGDALKELFDYMEARPDCGLLSTSILDETGKKATLPRYEYLGERYVGRVFNNLPGEIAWVLGASMMMPRELFNRIDGFDRQLFMYGDDIDLGLRVRQAGYYIACLESVVVRHIGGASEKKTSSYEKTLKKQKALHYLYQKHYADEMSVKLVQRATKRAFYRLLCYRLLSKFSNNSRYRQRQAHYQAIYDTGREFLSGNTK